MSQIEKIIYRYHSEDNSLLIKYDDRVWILYSRGQFDSYHISNYKHLINSKKDKVVYTLASNLHPVKTTK